jgi:ubiquinone/menaquinone biosynthesis C-methylase UbiE
MVEMDSERGGKTNSKPFVPALGHHVLTPLYDGLLRFATRESVWRQALLGQIRPTAGDVILDVGCGTGTLAVLLKQMAPEARVIGIDPDAEALEIARIKALRAGLSIEWQIGFARDAAEVAGRRSISKIVSSLVFHQVPVGEKRAGLLAMFEAVRPDGAIHVADYARQPTRLMKALFTTIEILDGVENTRPNADGLLESLLFEYSGRLATPNMIVATPTGAISLFNCNPAAKEQLS